MPKSNGVRIRAQINVPIIPSARPKKLVARINAELLRTLKDTDINIISGNTSKAD